MSGGHIPLHKAALSLFGGQIVAQALPFLASPVIARLFSTEQFAVFGTAMTVFGLFSVLAAGRYELAVVLPADDAESSHLVRGALVIALISGAAAFLALWLWGGAAVFEAKLPGLKDIAWMIALLTMFAGVQIVMQQWLFRRKRFGLIARLKVLQSIGITLGTLGFGYAGWKSGLEAGYLVGWALFASCTAWWVWRRYPLVEGAGVTGSMAALRTYKAWPLINSWPAIITTLASGMATFYMAAYQPTEAVGQHNFARQYLLVPISMVAIALGQVLFVRCAEEVREGRALLPELEPVLKLLIAGAIGLIVVMHWFAEGLFGFMFGEPWSMAGQASSVLVFGYAAQLVAAPFGIVLIALRAVKATLVFPMVFMGLMLLVPLFRHLAPLRFMGVLSVVEMIAYMVQVGVVFWCVRRYDRSLGT